MIHIYRVQVGPGKHGRQWWICDQKGERLLKSGFSVTKNGAIWRWGQHFNNNCIPPESVRYTGVARPSEVAMCMAELGESP